LLGLWLGLTRLAGGVHQDYAHIGITGLRLMPADDAGGVERSVPRAMLRGDWTTARPWPAGAT